MPKNEKFPCDDCITLAMCKARMEQAPENKFDNYPRGYYKHIIVCLCSICPMIRDYLHVDAVYDYNLGHRNHAIEFFSNRPIDPELWKPKWERE